MPAASNRGTGSNLLPLFDTSRTISEMTNLLTNSQETDPTAKSIGTPRLSVNGKRIGRPPGSFKVHPVKENSKGTPTQFKSDVPLVCKWDGCKQEFDSVEIIAKHVSDVHVDKKDRRFRCMWDGCNQRRFRLFYLLVQHVRCHTGEKPMKCQYEDCDKAYRRKENLTTHLRTHTGDKPYLCHHPLCDKCFTNASDRAKHESRCHTRERFYHCTVDDCRKYYTDPSSLRKHTIYHHGTEFVEQNRRMSRLAHQKTSRVAKQKEQKTPSPKPAPIQSPNLENHPNAITSFQSTNSAFRKVLPRNTTNNFSPAMCSPNENTQVFLMEYLNSQARALQTGFPITPLSYVPVFPNPMEQMMIATRNALVSMNLNMTGNPFFKPF